MVFEKTLIRGRALAALVGLSGAVDGLTISIGNRNELVSEQRNAKRTQEETAR